MSIQDTAALVRQLEDIFGQADPAFGAVAELDPEISAAFINMAQVTAQRGALAPKYRALISMCLSASVTHLKEKHTRMHMAHALKLGATKAEICEVLELASVLGIHGFIPGIQILVQEMGGLQQIKAMATPAQHQAAEDAKAFFLAARGYMGDIWEANCYLAPAFVKAYATYSGVPWKSQALPGKIKEFIYIAIDLSPTHGDIGGATFHMNASMSKHGATLDEVLEVLELIGLMGFQTHLLSLPILKEELTRAGHR
ncbi:MAG: carboxymuconolactone decarboxylase family protein [Paludibacter sp.]